MRTIYDYKDIRKLEQSLLSEELCSSVIVTATASLATELRAYYPEYIVIDMHQLIGELIPEWDESTKDLRNYISLRNSMEIYAAENENDPTLFLSLQRNAADIWNAILLLVEADVYPQDIPDNGPTPIQHFKRIWRQLEIENSTLMNLRAQFAFRLSNADNVKSSINSCIGRAYGNNDDVTNRRFFFLGFYFITPIQARIIDVLSNADIDIAYLNCRDPQYPYPGEIWEKTFEEEYSMQKSVDIQPGLSFPNSFGELLNGGSNGLSVEIINYASNLEFAQAMREPLRTGASLFTPDIKTCETILKEYYPECFERKHLLAYPVGQYIYYLHMMWNDLHGRLEMKYDYVYKCFSSGWLENGNANGQDYVYELSKLELFFKDCISLKDWRERFQILKNAKSKTERLGIKSDENERWHELLGNPFKQLSIYNLNDLTIEAIDGLLAKLMEDAEYLFSSTGKVRISDHFAKITEIIKGHMDREDVLSDEVEVAKELVRSLEIAGNQDQECPLSAVKDAIVLLIGGHFDEADTLDKETALTEEKIKPLSMVESSLLSNYGEDIYLILADEFTLPGKPRDLPWPLSDGLLDSLLINKREDTSRYVGQMRSVINNRPLSYRYLFFSLISNVNKENHPRLHLSWIRNQGSKSASPSPYILMMWPESCMQENTISPIDFEKEIEKIEASDSNTEISGPSGEVPEDVLMDLSLCKYRYLYSYLLNYLPEYKSEFHYPFLLTNLIKNYCIVTGKSKKDISELLFEMFPFFRNVELHQALDYAVVRREDQEPFIFENISYDPNRLNVHYIQLKKLALRLYEGGSIYDNERRDRCMYCPYSYVCIYKDEMMGK